MSTVPKVGGSHRDMIDDVFRLVRDPKIGESEARSLLDNLCSVAFRDGVIAGTTSTSDLIGRTFDAFSARLNGSAA